MHLVVSFFGPLVYFILANANVVLLTKKSFGKCLPITLIASAFIVYFSQVFFNTFNIGIIVNIVIALISIPILIYLFFRKKDVFNEFRDNFFKKGLLIFIVIYLLIYIYDFARTFRAWDEFMHWGVMLKEMVRLDKFYTVAESTLIQHKDYPPIIQTFEFFYIKLSGGFTEATALKALHILNLSLFVPVISEIKFKKNVIIKKILITIFLVLTSFFVIRFWDQHDVIDTIYIDYTLSIYIAYAIYYIIGENKLLSKFCIINISMIMAFLVLTKQISVIFYILILFLYICKIIVNNIDKIKNIKNIKLNKKNIIELILVLVFMIIVPILLWKGWSIYIGTLEIKTDFVEANQFNISEIKLTKLPSVLLGKEGEDYQHRAGKNFINALADKSISNSYIGLNFIQGFVLGELELLLLYKLGKKVINKHEFILLNVIFIIGAIGYCFVMLNMYVFLFGSYEGPILSSYNRYMATYIIMMFIVCLMFIIKLLNNIEKDGNKFFIILAVLFISIAIQNPQYLNRVYPKLTTYYDEKINDANIINSKTKELDKVYVLTQKGTVLTSYKIKFFSGDRIISYKLYKWTTDENGQLSDLQKDYIRKFDYLYINDCDQTFINKYKSYFINENVKEKNIYRIIKGDNGELSFKIIE